jgi:hypothetical protein
MLRFALCHIPPARSPFYRLGTSILGYSIASTMQQRAQENPEQFSPHEIHRALHFHYPYIFDDFRPHYTLLNPYTGDEHQQIANVLHNVFDGFK